MSRLGDTATMVQPPVPPPGASGLPTTWPSAWPSLWPALARRAAFVAALDLLTAIGLVFAADLTTQWWALLPPLLLLVGPLTRPARVRRRAADAALTGRLDLRPDGLIVLRPRRIARPRPFARLSSDGRIHYLD